MKKWVVVTELKCKAVSMIAAAVSKQVDYTVAVRAGAPEDMNCIFVRVEENTSAISIQVSEYDPEADRQNIVISAVSITDLLYAAADFENRYLPYAAESDNSNLVFNRLFEEPMKPYNYSSSPYIARRGLWTWGHVIYDYLRYIDHMVSLKFNELVIWNDYLPLNIREVVSYAHENGVRILLGFAWGWDTTMPDISRWEEISQQVIEEYRKSYADVPCDGIYMQTFTEHKEQTLNGLDVAETAIKLVNRVSSYILNDRPELEIQFGLHATSVKGRLDAFDALDKRVSIIWEDAGAFPYSYLPYQTDGFDKTLELNRKLQSLGGSRNGAVLKGVICLDWTCFQHQTGPYLMGEQSADACHISAAAMRKLRMAQAHWMANAEYARDMVLSFPRDSSIMALMEDGYFEAAVNFPAAVYSEILWDPNRSKDEIILAAARRQDVYFF